MSAPLVSERVGQFLIGADRLEYTEFGSGERWVVLLHGQLMSRTMHEPLARVLAAAGMHVVTLDLRMPGLGGIGVLERIKAHGPDIEALIISGYNSFDSAVDGMRLRAFDYVSKPFDIEHVRDLVRRAVDRRRAVRRRTGS